MLFIRYNTSNGRYEARIEIPASMLSQPHKLIAQKIPDTWVKVQMSLRKIQHG